MTFHVFICSPLEYCHPLFTYPIKMSQVVPNPAAELLTKSSSSSDGTAILVSLLWFPIKFRIQSEGPCNHVESLVGSGTFLH